MKKISIQTLILSLLCFTLSSTKAMELSIAQQLHQTRAPVYPEGLKAYRALLAELEKAASKKIFDRYFELFFSASLETQKRLCGNNSRPLHVAAAHGNVEILKRLLALGARIESWDENRTTPLLCAAEKGNREALLFLLSNGANKYARTRDGMDALHMAAMGGQVSIIEMLVKEYAFNVNSTCCAQYTPLHYAAIHGKVGAINTLMELGARATMVDVLDRTALHFAAEAGRADSIVCLISIHNFDPNVRDRLGRTPLHNAAECGKFEAVTELIAHKANLSAVSTDGLGVLHYAVKSNNVRVVALLIKEHAPYYRIDRTHIPASTLIFETPLGCALLMGSCLATFALRSTGAELSEREKNLYDGCCLSELKTNADKTVVLDALMTGSLAPWDPNSQENSDRSTALIRAVKNNCLKCVCFLLKDKRTDPNIQDTYKKTVLHYVLEYLHRHIISDICARLLNLRAINLALQDENGYSAPALLKQKLQESYNSSGFNDVIKAFELRKIRVQAYLSLINARCSEQCTEESCSHIPRLIADICFKIVGLLTEESLPEKTLGDPKIGFNDSSDARHSYSRIGSHEYIQ